MRVQDDFVGAHVDAGVGNRRFRAAMNEVQPVRDDERAGATDCTNDRSQPGNHLYGRRKRYPPLAPAPQICRAFVAALCVRVRVWDRFLTTPTRDGGLRRLHYGAHCTTSIVKITAHDSKLFLSVAMTAKL